MGRINGAYICGYIFALLDLLQGIAILAFYSLERWYHRHCSYAHGVQECEYYYFRSNHSVRVIIGLVEGIVCILISIGLIFCYKKENIYLVWGWLVKPLIFIILNLYYVSTWLIERGRYYHSYETEDQVWQESVFIYFGAGAAVSYLILAIIFCCTSAGLVVRARRRTRHLSANSISTETKV